MIIAMIFYDAAKAPPITLYNLPPNHFRGIFFYNNILILNDVPTTASIPLLDLLHPAAKDPREGTLSLSPILRQPFKPDQPPMQNPLHPKIIHGRDVPKNN